MERVALTFEYPEKKDDVIAYICFMASWPYGQQMTVWERNFPCSNLECCLYQIPLAVLSFCENCPICFIMGVLWSPRDQISST